MMKTCLLFICCSLLSLTLLHAQQPLEKKVDSRLDSVKVFLQGAQLNRSASVRVPAGQSRLVLHGLSPFIDPQSIQVRSASDILILSVNHRQDYLGEEEENSLEKKLSELKDSVQVEKAMLEVLQEEMDFLKKNNTVSGTNSDLSLEDLKAISAYYQERMKNIRLEKLEINRRIQQLEQEVISITRQLSQWNQMEATRGEILLTVDSKKAQQLDLQCSYKVANASWFPAYDLRARDVQSPVQLMYKAKLQQNSGEDWQDVRLSFSNTNPENSGRMPQLNPDYLNFNNYPANRSMLGYAANPNVRQVSGRVTDAESGETLPGVNVLVQGTSVGSITDMNGNYQISIPQGASQLVFSFIGFQQQLVPISSERINVALYPDVMQLSEVVVSSLRAKAAGVRIEEDIEREAIARPVPSTQVENQTSVEFRVDIPYSVPSDGQTYTVDLSVLEIPAYYEYQCVPKLEKDAFLIARITNWEQYNLLEGEANLFFENTFVGKTLLDVRFARDTLEISLGRDQNVYVERNKIEDFTRKQFIGNNQVESRGWRLIARNNKSQTVKLVLVDRVPLSRTSEIEVQDVETSGGKVDTDTGIVRWELQLQGVSTAERELRYAVKYPKNRNLYLE
jgi:hypothetical protein